MTATDFKRASFTSALFYRDPKAALEWLESAFGFKVAMLVTDEKGEIGHSEMRFGDSLVMIGSEWSAEHRAPASLGGKNTQTVHVHLEKGLDAHCAHACKAGAEILQEPSDQFYGERIYRARDPEGHIWTFGQTVRVMSPEQMSEGPGSR